jgi:hypothetical protein
MAPLGSLLGGVGGGVIGSAVVELVGDSAKLKKDVALAQKQVDSSTKGMAASGAKFGTAWKIGALVAGAAIIKFGASSVQAFKEAQLVGAQTENVIRSTGGAANVTAEQVGNLAQRMQDYSGVEDEVIQRGQNLLLTFTNIRNEVGAGNDIFNQASEIMLDMSVAMNQGSLQGLDMKTTVIQLGKALQDPIRGMTALRRVGVNFNDAQAETIAKLVESGDLLSAQKLILAELRTEFGGAAKAAGDTFAGSLAKLSNKVDDLQEKVGAALVPILSVLVDAADDVVGVVGPLLIGIAKLIGGFGDDLPQAIELSVTALAALTRHPVIATIAALVALFDELRGRVDIFSTSAKENGAVVGALDAVYKPLRDSMGSTFQELMGGQSAMEGATVSAAGMTVAMQNSSAAIRESGVAAVQGADDQQALADAHMAAAGAAREQQLAELSLAGGLLGIEAAGIDAAASQRELREAQAEVNRLTENGKRGTAEYREALRNLREAQLNAVQSQLSLRESVLNYAKELVDAGGSTRDAKALIRDLGRDAGLSAGDIRQLISRIDEYRNAIERVPTSRTTTFTIKIAGANVPLSQLTGGELGGIVAGQSGFITKGPTILVGEGRRSTFAGMGSEAVIPFDERGIGILAKALGKAGGGRSLAIGKIDLYVDASGVPPDGPEFARAVADALYGMMLDEVGT